MRRIKKLLLAKQEIVTIGLLTLPAITALWGIAVTNEVAEDAALNLILFETAIPIALATKKILDKLLE
jgi:hypothetical protein